MKIDVGGLEKEGGNLLRGVPPTKKAPTLFQRRSPLGSISPLTPSARSVTTMPVIYPALSACQAMFAKIFCTSSRTFLTPFFRACVPRYNRPHDPHDKGS